MPFTAWITPFVLSRCVKWTTHRAASLTQFSPLAVKLVQDAELRCGELLHLCRVNPPGLCFSGFSEWQFVFSLQQLMSRFLPITGASFSLHTAWPHNFLVITGFSWAGEQSYRGIAMVRKNRVWKMLVLLLCTRNVALPGMPFALAVPPLVRSKRGVAMWLCGTWAAQDDGQKGKGRKGIKKGLKERSYFAFWISPDQLFEKCRHQRTILIQSKWIHLWSYNYFFICLSWSAGVHHGYLQLRVVGTFDTMQPLSLLLTPRFHALNSEWSDLWWERRL